MNLSATTIEWIAVGIFFTGLFVLSLAEGGWLNKRSSVPFGKAFAFAFATNTFAISIGFFVSFVILAVLMMLAFGGSLEGLSGNDWRIWTAVITAFLFPVALLIGVKRLGLRIFKMTSVRSPWAFSASASIVFLAAATSLPIAFVYFAPSRIAPAVPAASAIAAATS